MDQYVGVIAGIVVLLIIIGYVIYKKKQINPEDNDQVKEFIKSLELIFEDAILKYIKTIDISTIQDMQKLLTINDIQMKIIDDMYSELYKKAIEALANLNSLDDFTRKLIKTFLTKENIEKVAQVAFGSNKVQEQFKTSYDNAVMRAAWSKIEIC